MTRSDGQRPALHGHCGCAWPTCGAGPVRIAPSLLAAKPLSLSEEVSALMAAGTKVLHIDVMDGHFVPNLAFSPAQVRALAAQHGCLLDVHLMVSEPLIWLQPFAEAGASSITVHLEALDDAPAALHRLAALQVGRGISLSPETQLAALTDALHGNYSALDLLLVMGVQPGFGGQRLGDGTATKVAEARVLRAERGAQYSIVVDGGVTLNNVGLLAAAGADACVVGTDLLHKPPYAERLAAYGAAWQQHLP